MRFQSLSNIVKVFKISGEYCIVANPYGHLNDPDTKFVNQLNETGIEIFRITLLELEKEIEAKKAKNFDATKCPLTLQQLLDYFFSLPENKLPDICKIDKSGYTLKHMRFKVLDGSIALGRQENAPSYNSYSFKVSDFKSDIDDLYLGFYRPLTATNEAALKSFYGMQNRR